MLRRIAAVLLAPSLVSGLLQVRVRDALTEAHVTAAACKLLQAAGGGKNVLEYTAVNTSGYCRLPCDEDAGLSVLVTAPGHYDTETTVAAANDTVTVLLQPRLALDSSDVRFVLTWGTNLTDVDLWVVTPWGCASGPPAFGAVARSAVCNESVTGATVTHHGDKTVFRGPESITISGAASGTFAVWAHVYSNGQCWDEGADVSVSVLQASDGGVTHTLGMSELLGCGTSPRDGGACRRYWHVLDYDGSARTVRVLQRFGHGLDIPAEATPAPAPSITCQCNARADRDSFVSNLLPHVAAAADGLVHRLVTGGPACADHVQREYDRAESAAEAVDAAGLAAGIAAAAGAEVESRQREVDAMHAALLAGLAAPGTATPATCCSVFQSNCSSCSRDYAWGAAVDRSSMCTSLPNTTDQASADASRRAVQGSAALWRGLVQRPDSRWAFAGFADGLMAIAPVTAATLGGSPSCGGYDPRLRPWFAEAASGAKDVVVVIDCSSAVPGKDHEVLRRAAYGVLSTLSLHDTVSVVAVGGSGVRTAGWNTSDGSYRACEGAQMMQASEENVAHMRRFVAEGVSFGTAAMNATAGIGAAGALLGTAQTGRNATPLILVLSATSPPQPASELQAAKPANATVVTYLLAGASAGGLAAVGSVVAVGADNASLIPALYHLRPEVQRPRSESFAAAVYADRTTRRAVVSVVRPVVESGEVRAVAGLDIELTSLLSAVVYKLRRTFDSSYAFAIGSLGEALYHHLLPPLDATERWRAVHVTEVESSPEFVSTVLPALLSSETGSATITVTHNVPRGDPTLTAHDTVTSTYVYAWDRVRNSDVKVCVAMNTSEATVQNYTRPVPRWNLCQVYHTLGVKTPCEGRNGTELHSKSTFMIALAGFENPHLTVRVEETNATVSEIESMVEQGFATGATTEASNITQSALDDVRLTAAAERCWLDRPFTDSPMRMLATQGGVYRRLPGKESERGFTAQESDWYLAAVSARKAAGGSKHAVLPLQDGGEDSAQPVVTLATSFNRSVHAIGGVAAMRLTAQGFARLMVEALPQCRAGITCVLVDTSANVLWTAGMDACGSRIQRQHLVDAFPAVATELAAVGMLEGRHCRDTMHMVQRSTYALREEARSGLFTATSGCGWWAVQPLKRVAAVLVAVSQGSCPSAGTCTRCTCAAVSAATATLCTPCACGVDFDRCSRRVQYGGLPAALPCGAVPAEYRCSDSKAVEPTFSVPCGGARSGALGVVAVVAAAVAASAAFL